jgi:hypothetical protein
MSDTRVKAPNGWKDAKGEDDGRTVVKIVNGQIKTYSATVTTGAFTTTTTLGNDFPGHSWRLKHIAVTFSTAPTTSQSLTLTLVSPNPARPDTVLFSTDPSVTSATSVLNTWAEDELRLEYGQEVTLAFTNTDNRTIKAEIAVEVI